MAQEPEPMEGLRCFVEGKEATADDVKDSQVTVWISKSSDEQNIHVFRTEETYRTWISATEYKFEAAKIDGVMRMAWSLKDKDHSRAERLHKSRANWVTQELDQLARDTGLRPGSAELFRRATIEAPFIEGPISNTAFVHEHWDGTGGMVPLAFFMPVPDFGWFGMNDKATSLSFTPAGGVLTEDIWYQGRVFIFLGMHTWDPPMQIGWAGWNDIASAGYKL